MNFIYDYTEEDYNSVIELLEGKGKRLSFNQLYAEWVKKMRQFPVALKRKKNAKSKLYSPSISTFANLLRRMLKDRYLKHTLDNNSDLKIKKEYYELTDDARKLLQIKVLKMDDKQRLYKIIYAKMLFYDFFERMYWRILNPSRLSVIHQDILFPYRTVKQINIDSEDQLCNLLSEMDVNYKDLIWGYQADIHSSEFVQILDNLNSRSKYSARSKREYWKKMSNESKVREGVIRFCYPMKDRNDYDFTIYKIETWDVLREHKYGLVPKLISAKFIVFLPGLTVPDLIQGDELDESKIRDAIDILHKYGLVKASIYGNEIRYIIADNDLNNFINAIKNYFISELDFRLHRWEHFESPTEDEKRRMESIFGEKGFKRVRTNSEIKVTRTQS